MPRPIVPAPIIATVVISMRSPSDDFRATRAWRVAKYAKRAAERAGPRCRTEFCAALQRKSAKREIVRYCRELWERRDPASPCPTELYRQFRRCAEKIPSAGAAGCPKYPCTYSDGGEPGKMLRSSTAGGRRAPE